MHEGLEAVTNPFCCTGAAAIMSALHSAGYILSLANAKRSFEK